MTRLNGVGISRAAIRSVNMIHHPMGGDCKQTVMPSTPDVKIQESRL